MNWDAIGAMGEVVGAIAVVFTLFFLVIQLRLNTKAMQESNVFQRAQALDRHTESVSKWRGMLAENEDSAALWLKALTDHELSSIEHLRLSNVWVSFVNTQRSNFERATAVGEEGLATMTTKSVAAEIVGSQTLKGHWDRAAPWHALASPKFVERVNLEIKNHSGESDKYQSGSWLKEMDESVGD